MVSCFSLKSLKSKSTKNLRRSPKSKASFQFDPHQSLSPECLKHSIQDFEIENSDQSYSSAYISSNNSSLLPNQTQKIRTTHQPKTSTTHDAKSIYQSIPLHKSNDDDIEIIDDSVSAYSLVDEHETTGQIALDTPKREKNGKNLAKNAGKLNYGLSKYPSKNNESKPILRFSRSKLNLNNGERNISQANLKWNNQRQFQSCGSLNESYTRSPLFPNKSNANYAHYNTTQPGEFSDSGQTQSSFESFLPSPLSLVKNTEKQLNQERLNHLKTQKLLEMLERQHSYLQKENLAYKKSSKAQQKKIYNLQNMIDNKAKNKLPYLSAVGATKSQTPKRKTLTPNRKFFRNSPGPIISAANYDQVPTLSSPANVHPTHPQNQLNDSISITEEIQYVFVPIKCKMSPSISNFGKKINLKRQNQTLNSMGMMGTANVKKIGNFYGGHSTAGLVLANGNLKNLHKISDFDSGCVNDNYDFLAGIENLEIWDFWGQTDAEWSNKIWQKYEACRIEIYRTRNLSKKNKKFKHHKKKNKKVCSN